MGFHPADPALVAVHLVILRQAACHDCGWLSDLTDSQAEADGWAEAHDCWRAWRDSNPRPLHP